MEILKESKTIEQITVMQTLVAEQEQSNNMNNNNNINNNKNSKNQTKINNSKYENLIEMKASATLKNSKKIVKSSYKHPSVLLL